MSARPKRHLRVVEVDDRTGEVEIVSAEELAARIKKLEADLDGAEKDLRVKRRRITELQRDKMKERLEHPDREFIVRVCEYWHKRCRRADFDGRRRINPLSPDRFDAVTALAEMEEIAKVDGKRTRVWRYQAEHFKAAIDGAAFDPYTPPQKNGRQEPQNDLEQICRAAAKFEKAMGKAPYLKPGQEWMDLPALEPARVSPDLIAAVGPVVVGEPLVDWPRAEVDAALRRARVLA